MSGGKANLVLGLEHLRRCSEKRLNVDAGRASNGHSFHIGLTYAMYHNKCLQNKVS